MAATALGSQPVAKVIFKFMADVSACISFLEIAVYSKKHSCVRARWICVRAQFVDLNQKKGAVLKYEAIN